jgi:predicted TIM-barrel fold metal-dependent hydrolase
MSAVIAMEGCKRIAFGVLFIVLTSFRSVAFGSTSNLWNVDHHMHLASPALCRLVDDCLASNAPAAVFALDAIHALDDAGIARGVILSCAYLFGMESLHVPPDEIPVLTRRENEFTANQIAQYPHRLVGFFSVDPLQPSAIAEIVHWQSSSRLIGLKLHLPASGVNLRNESHRRKLVEAMATAANHSLPIVIHIGGGDFDAVDAELFILQVLPVASRSWVQIAHMGGGEPSYGRNNLDVLTSFADHIVRGDPATKRVLFDVSYIPTPSSSRIASAAVVKQMRRIGLQRFLFGSDFNVQSPTTEIRNLGRLKLSEREMALLRHNCAPWTCHETWPSATAEAVPNIGRPQQSAREANEHL